MMYVSEFRGRESEMRIGKYQAHVDADQSYLESMYKESNETAFVLLKLHANTARPERFAG